MASEAARCPMPPALSRVDWDSVDAWFEEDEEVHGHPRNPYHRVDCLRASDVASRCRW